MDSDGGAHALVGLPSDTRDIDGQPFHVVGDKYLRAVATACPALPLAIPAMNEAVDARAVIERLDGLMLTGARSNVHPERYGAAEIPEAEPFDRERDASTFALLAAALAARIPLLAICRGFQELNAYFGGTLHPRVHEIPGRLDHRRPEDPDPDVQYAPRHRVDFAAAGTFATLLGEDSIEVNSLHWQAIDRLAPALVAEGVAEDGTIEAVRLRDHDGFALGVQWHPEYEVERDPYSVKLFRAFGDAVRERAAERRG